MRTLAPRRSTALLATIALLVAPALAACGGGEDTKDAGTSLVGILKFDAGKESGGTISGSYFRMVQVGGTIEDGPYMTNADSKADKGETTLLAPGNAGGLRLGGYQTQPTPAFDPKGNSLAADIMKPAGFFGVNFSVSTNPVDPQTKAAVAPPTAKVVDGKLIVDLSSWGVTWNNQVFNQGAPKPVAQTDAKALGQEKAEKVWDWVSQKYLDSAAAPTIDGKSATGTYDAKTGRFTLEWVSLIEGGPFNRFTGLWHLEGTFVEGKAAPDQAG